MADAQDYVGALPAPLAIRCVDGPAPSLGASRWVEDEEEKTNEAHADAIAATRTRRFSGDSESISKTVLKERPRAGSAGSQDVEGDDERDSDGGNNSGSARAQLKGKQRSSPRSAPAVSGAGAQYAMRSPSRLAASLLVGRDRMARAARAWREGARRAGLFGAEDEDYDEGDIDEDEHEESKSAWAGDHPAYWSDRMSSKRSSVSDPTSNLQEPIASRDDGSSQVPDLLSIEQDPAADESNETFAARVVRATTLPVSVPRLVPSRLAPATRVPKMAQLWACLDRIECITIREVFTTHDDDDSGATVHYLLDVYHYQEQHSLPTHRYQGSHRGTTPTRRSLPHAPSNAPPSRKPDYQIEHRFSSFTKLRRRVLEAAQLKHPNARAFLREGDAVSGSHHRNCPYCRRVALFIASGNECVAPLGWRAKLFTTVETRKTLLGQFISELVFLAREQRDMCSNLATLAMMPQPPSRHVHRSVPGILRRFLTVQTGENYMR